MPADALPAPGPEGWTVVVGPEGGLDPAELEPFPDSVPRLAVGPHVLRAETAPPAVVAALAWSHRMAESCVTRGTRHALCSS